MAGYLTTHAANAILNGSPMPTTFYASSALDDPGNAGTANSSAETRRAGFSLAEASSGLAANGSVGSITAVAASETWTHLVLWDAPSGGNSWWIVPLSAPVAVTAGHTVRIAAGAVELALAVWS